MIDLVGYKTNCGSVVIEKIYLDNKNYKWKTVCGKCKKEFLSTKRILTDTNKIGLCVSCVRKLTSQNRLNLEGKRIGRWSVILQSDIRDKHGNVKYECVCDCGQMKLVSGSALNAEKSNSCGCLQIDVAKSMSGSKSPHWKNIKKKRIRPLDTEDVKRHSLRKYIYKRDGYICYLCSSRENLRAHHMNGWKWAIDERFEETNLITLCNNHHTDFHRKYGSGKNTIEEFKEYSLSFSKKLEDKISEILLYKEENGFTCIDNLDKDKTCLV